MFLAGDAVLVPVQALVLLDRRLVDLGALLEVRDRLRACHSPCPWRRSCPPRAGTSSAAPCSSCTWSWRRRPEIEPTAATGSERARTETTEAAMRREREDTRRDCGFATDFVPSSHERCRFVTRSRPCRPDRPRRGSSGVGSSLSLPSEEASSTGVDRAQRPEQQRRLRPDGQGDRHRAARVGVRQSRGELPRAELVAHRPAEQAGRRAADHHHQHQGPAEVAQQSVTQDAQTDPDHEPQQAEPRVAGEEPGQVALGDRGPSLGVQPVRRQRHDQPPQHPGAGPEPVARARKPTTRPV